MPHCGRTLRIRKAPAPAIAAVHTFETMTSRLALRLLELVAPLALALGCGGPQITADSPNLAGYDEDHDGIDDGIDSCLLEAEDVDGFQDDDGCADPGNVQSGVADPAPDDRPPQREEVLDVVFFDRNSAEIRADRGPLDACARLAIEEHTRLAVVGHASGDENQPRGLSLRRAQAVRDYLVKHGVPASQIHILAAGAAKPGGTAGGGEKRSEHSVEITVEK